VALRDEQSERETLLDRRRTTLTEIDQEILRQSSRREALAAEVAQRRLEKEAYEREAQRHEKAVADARTVLQELDRELERAEKSRDKALGEIQLLEANLNQLQNERRDVAEKVAQSQKSREKAAEENGRLDAERSRLWTEFVGLQEKRNSLTAEIRASEMQARELRAGRDALHAEIEMLKRIVGRADLKHLVSAAAR
jgi:chromosome segregation ATPase